MTNCPRCNTPLGDSMLVCACGYEPGMERATEQLRANQKKATVRLHGKTRNLLYFLTTLLLTALTAAYVLPIVNVVISGTPLLSPASIATLALNALPCLYAFFAMLGAWILFLRGKWKRGLIKMQKQYLGIMKFMAILLMTLLCIALAAVLVIVGLLSNVEVAFITAIVDAVMLVVSLIPFLEGLELILSALIVGAVIIFVSAFNLSAISCMGKYYLGMADAVRNPQKDDLQEYVRRKRVPVLRPILMGLVYIAIGGAGVFALPQINDFLGTLLLELPLDINAVPRAYTLFMLTFALAGLYMILSSIFLKCMSGEQKKYAKRIRAAEHIVSDMRNATDEYRVQMERDAHRAMARMQAEEEVRRFVEEETAPETAEAPAAPAAPAGDQQAQMMLLMQQMLDQQKHTGEVETQQNRELQQAQMMQMMQSMLRQQQAAEEQKKADEEAQKAQMMLMIQEMFRQQQAAEEQKKADEEAARLTAEAQRKAEEEAALAAAEAERRAAEEAALAAAEAERRAAEEAIRAAEEAEKRAAEEEAARIAAEEAERKAAEEAAIRAAEAARAAEQAAAYDAEQATKKKPDAKQEQLSELFEQMMAVRKEAPAASEVVLDEVAVETPASTEEKPEQA